MTNFLTRLTELAGSETATALVAEFGGQTVFLPKPCTPVALRLQISAVIDPIKPMAVVTSALATAIFGLNGSGVLVQSLQLETRGLGQSYLEALQARPELGSGVAVQSFTPAQ